MGTPTLVVVCFGNWLAHLTFLNWADLVDEFLVDMLSEQEKHRNLGVIWYSPPPQAVRNDPWAQQNMKNSLPQQILFSRYASIAAEVAGFEHLDALPALLPFLQS